MTAVWTTLIAVTGTLLGALSTHLLQARATHRREHAQTLLTEARALAVTLIKLREVQYPRQHLRAHLQHNGADHRQDPAYQDLKSAADQLRSTASGHLFALRALNTTPRVQALATELADISYTLHEATDQADLHARHTRVHQLNNELAAAIGTLIR